MSHTTPGHWFPLVRDLTLELVRFPSITNTAGEVAFAQHLHALLAAHPYFQANPGHLRIERAPDDPHGRSNVFALVHGGPRAVALTGHYDVVSVENYGDLAPYACEPDELLPRLIADLEHDARDAGDLLALQDLKGGDYMPGRGALDMKSGVAAGIAQLFHLAELGERPGSLLLVATPDEEQTSQGMRAAAARLPSLAQEWGLELVAAINLDSTTDRGDGSEGQVIYLGSVGKLLPSVYVVGRDTHAGAPFDGVGANLLAAEITRRIECNPDLADMAAGEAAPPPVCLKQADLKNHYDVTTPAAAWCYYNMLTYSWSPSQVLEKIGRLVQEALDATIAELEERAQRYAALTGGAPVQRAWQPRALTFADLKRRALARSGASGRAGAGRSARAAGQRHRPAHLLPARHRAALEAERPQRPGGGGRHRRALLPARLGRYHQPAAHQAARGGRPPDRCAETGSWHRRRAAPVLHRHLGHGLPGGTDTPEEIAVVAGNTPGLGHAHTLRLRRDWGASPAGDQPRAVGPRSPPAHRARLYAL